MSTTPEKLVLDPCCGSRMFWFNKQHPNAVYGDIRSESHELCDGRALNINPDIVMDFRDMPFDDDQFNLTVFDPPHLKSVGKNSWMAKKYGILSENWKEDLKKGFDECWRVTRPGGVIIFKWSEKDVKVSEVLRIFGREPLFGHKTTQNMRAIWLCFLITN